MRLDACLTPRNTPRTSTAKVKSHSSDGGLPDGPEGAAHPRVVEDAVEALEALDREGDEARDVELRRDVSVEHGQPTVVALRAGERDGLGEPRLVQVADHHPGALAKKRERGGAADAAAAPGDDRDLAVEAPAHRAAR